MAPEAKSCGQWRLNDEQDEKWARPYEEAAKGDLQSSEGFVWISGGLQITSDSFHATSKVGKRKGPGTKTRLDPVSDG